MEFKNRFGVEEIRELYSASESNVGAMNIFNLDETVGFVATAYAIVEFDTESESAIKNSKGYFTKVAKGGQGLLIGKITKATPFSINDHLCART